jgi:hypothetical protein
MKKFTQRQLENREKIVQDKKLSLTKRKEAHKEIVKDFMNPDENFNPDTFDNRKGDANYEVKKRIRVEPTRRLPSMGMQPKELLEGQMVGMFESKQDLYLLIAWLSERVSDLEDNKKL